MSRRAMWSGHRRAPAAWAAVATCGAVAAGVGACGGADGATWAGTEVDSAGIAIVTNPSTEGIPRSRGVVELSIGGDEARPETLFGYVADVDVDARGRMYVLDQHAQTVRVFGPDGASAGSIGAAGEGPGELSAFAASLLITGDTLGIGDWGRYRVHRFLLDGTFVDARTFPGEPGARSWWRAGPDGAVLFRSFRRAVEEGRWTGHDALYRVSGDWASPDTLLEFDYAMTDVGGPGNVRLSLLVNAPFWTRLAGGSVGWGTLQSAELRVVRDGTLERIVRAEDWRLRPPTEADGRALVALAREKMGMMGGNPDAVDVVPVDHPASLPALTSVQAGPEGTVWVQRGGDAAHAHPMALNTPDPPVGWGGPLWDVVDASGRIVRVVALPAGLRVTRIAGGMVYGVQRDELGVESVVRIRLEPEEGA